jgi:hypothetical protein
MSRYRGDFILPNVKDEPRRELARRVQPSIAHLVDSYDSWFLCTRRDRSRRWLWRLVRPFFFNKDATARWTTNSSFDQFGNALKTRDFAAAFLVEPFDLHVPTVVAPFDPVLAVDGERAEDHRHLVLRKKLCDGREHLSSAERQR